MKFFKSLSFRLVSFLLLVGMLIFIPMATLIVMQTRESLENQVIDNALMVNSMILHSTSYSMLQHDNEAIKQTLLAFKKMPEIVNVRIYGKRGIAFSMVPEENGAELDRKKSPACVVCHRSKNPLAEIPAADAVRFDRSNQGERILVSSLPIENSTACAQCHPSPDEIKVLGVVETTLSLKKADEQIAASQWEMILFSVLAILALEALSMAFIWWYVHRRVFRLAEANGKVAKGDYSSRSDVAGEDEIGYLSDSFNEMMDRIERQRADNLSLIDNMGQAVRTITASANELLAIASQQASGVTEQVATIQELVSTAQEISLTAAQISQNSDSVKTSAQDTTEVCDRGKHYVGVSVAGMDQIQDRFDEVAKEIAGMAELAGKIGGIAELIEEISDQTSLLSLNAAIEAAGAGAAGRRFAVVAEEVQRLSNQTLLSTELVQKNVNRALESIRAVEALGEEEKKAVADGVASVRTLVSYFEETLAKARVTQTRALEISHITRQQTTASQQMVDSIREVEMVANENLAASKRIEMLVSDLSAMASQLDAMVSEKDELT